MHITKQYNKQMPGLKQFNNKTKLVNSLEYEFLKTRV